MSNSANNNSAADTHLPKFTTEDTAELSETEKALRSSEIRYRRLFEAAQVGILLLNAKTAQIEDANPYLIQMLGYTYEELLGKKLWEIGAFKDTALSKEVFAELQKIRHIRYENIPLETKGGSLVSVEFVSSVYDCDDVDVVQCDIRDITERYRAQLDLQATIRLLKMISETNAALVNAKTETTLLAEYCRIAVETGGYRMAWIGFADEVPDKRVQTIAHYGHEDGYLALAEITWAETAHGYGPTGRAIREGQVQVSEVIAADPTMAPWCEEALKRGYQSSISVPFQPSEGVMACLTLFGANRYVWSDPERKVLQEIAADLAFGITALRTAIDKDQYQKRLHASLEQTIQVIADTIDQRDAYTAGHQRRVAGLSSQIAYELGLPDDRIHGLHLAATIHDLGKIGIPAELLVKPVHLSEMEFGLVKDHVNIGFKIIKDISFPWPIAQIILQHHERIDGSGYPQGLTGEALLLESKILAVADVVETMASHRPYRPALGIEAALAEITAHRGITLDSEVVNACLRLFSDKGYKIEV